MTPDTPSDRTQASTADILYGGAAPPPPPTDRRPLATTGTVRATPDDLSTNESGEQAPADQLYGSVATVVSTYGPALADSVDRLSDRVGMSQVERDEHLSQMALVFDDARILPEEAYLLHALLVQHIAAPPDETTLDAWTTESRRQLRERYGLDEAARRLDVVRTFVKNRPALQQILTTTGLGSHPDVVCALAAHPQSIRLTPRTAAAARGN